MPSLKREFTNLLIGKRLSQSQGQSMRGSRRFRKTLTCSVQNFRGGVCRGTWKGIVDRLLLASERGFALE